MGESRMLGNLKAKLHRLGYDVRDAAGDGIKVLLPLFCSVLISYDGEILRLVPRLGFAKRSTATSLISVLLLISIGLLLLPSVDLIEMVLYICLVADSILVHICQYVLTEGAVTRIQYLVANDAGFMNQGEVA